MNKKRLLQLADIVENQIHSLSFFDSSGFNMRYVQHDCGTPSCIAGFVLEQSELKWDDSMYYTNHVAEYLDISHEDAIRLCEPSDIERRFWQDITPSQAAKTIRRLVDTGEVKWIRE